MDDLVGGWMNRWIDGQVTDAGWIHESKHSRRADWIKQVSRCRGRYRAGRGHARQCCAVSGTTVFEELSLSVLCGAEMQRGVARPGRALTGRGQFQHFSDPMASAPERGYDKATIQWAISPARLAPQWVTLTGPLSQPCSPALSSRLRELTLDGNASPFRGATHS